jgi:hypothetical protein
VIWAALLPVLIGAALALPLWRFGERLPRIPAGDIVGAAESTFRTSFVLGGIFGIHPPWPSFQFE